MNNTTLIRYLIDGSISHRVVTELKSSGNAMDFDALMRKLNINRGNLENSINSKSPAITKKGSKVLLNKNYSFVVVEGRSQLSKAVNLSKQDTYREKQELPSEVKDFVNDYSF